MGLSAEEVCVIIKVCGEAKVTELKLGDLQVIFLPKEETRPGVTLKSPLASLDQAPPPLTAAEIAEIQRKEAKKALERDEARVRKEQLEEMFLTDPLRAEELLRQGELEPDGDEDEEA